MPLLLCSWAAASACLSRLGEHSHSHLWRTRYLESVHKPAILPGDLFLEDSYIICGPLVVLCLFPRSGCEYSNTLIRPRAAWFTLTVPTTYLHHHPGQERGQSVSKSEREVWSKVEDSGERLHLNCSTAPPECGRKLDRRECALTRWASEQKSHLELLCPEATVSV